MFKLTLTKNHNDHESIDGTFTVTDGGVLTVKGKGMVPRIYSPSAWLMVEDFRRRETPVIDDVALG